jgi:hypothetical protein
MSNIDIPNVVPSIFMIEDPTTTSKSILRKQELEFLPHQLGNFTYESDRIMRFTLSSNTDVLVGPESYFRFNLQLTKTDAVSGNNREFFGARLEPSGVHNLFRSIEIRALSSGMLIQRYDHYNKYAAMYSYLNQSKDEVRSYGAMYLDQLDEEKTKCDVTYRPLRGGLAEVSNDGTGAESFMSISTTANSTAGSGHLWVTFRVAGAFIKANNLQPGDQLFNEGAGSIVAAGITWTADESLRVVAVDANLGEVSLIAANSAISPGVGGPVTINTVAQWDNIMIFRNESFNIGSIGAQQMYNHQRVDPQDMWNVRGTSEIHFKPFCSMLQHNIPLFLFRGGIEVIFELEDPNVCLYSTSQVAGLLGPTRTAGASAGSFSYAINSARFMGSMITPHPDIVTEYVNQWKTNRGLIYRIPSFEVRRVSRVKSQSENLSMHFGVRSALKGYLLQMDADDDQSSLARLSNTTWMKMNLNNYQFKVGSHEFPHRDIDVSRDSFSIYKHLCLMASDNLGPQKRLDYQSFGGLGFSSAVRDQNFALEPLDAADNREANKFIIPVDFSRVKGYGENGLTGIDLSIVPLETRLSRSRVPVGATELTTDNITYYMFVEYDAYLKVSASQMNVLS